MSPRAIRRLVVAVFVAGIGGMIYGSIKDSNGFAITAGVLTAIAAFGLILITAVAPAGSLAKPATPDPDASTNEGGRADDDLDVDDASAIDADAAAQDVEARVEALVAAGADELEVRRLVRRAIDFGRASAPSRAR
jgi:hypothetical protein